MRILPASPARVNRSRIPFQFVSRCCLLNRMDVTSLSDADVSFNLTSIHNRLNLSSTRVISQYTIYISADELVE